MPDSGQEVFLWPGNQGNSFRAVRAHGSFPFPDRGRAQRQWCDRALPRAAAIGPIQYLDTWLSTVAKPRLPSLTLQDPRELGKPSASAVTLPVYF